MEFLVQKIAIAKDHVQHVIEIMGHSPGQPAHRFHLLGLEKLALQAPFAR